MNTFIWVEDFGGGSTKKPIVTQVKYGDGYEQRFAQGMNTISRDTTLIFSNRDQSEWQAIDSFLTTAGGVAAFLWTPALESTQIVVVCDTWSITKVKGNRATINATFRQVFES